MTVDIQRSLNGLISGAINHLNKLVEMFLIIAV